MEHDADAEKQAGWQCRKEDPLLLSPQTGVNNFRKVIRLLQLDHSSSCWGLLSWLVALLLLVLVPVLKLVYVQPADESRLVFQPLVTVVGTLSSLAAFLFLNRTIRRYGLRGILFLDSAAEEPATIQKKYQSTIEDGFSLLAKLFFPALVLYTLQKSWLYSQVKLRPLPLGLKSRSADLLVVIVTSALSWAFQTTTYLYTCVLFYKVCVLQKLRMEEFKRMLGSRELEPESSFQEYTRIIHGTRAASKRFRMFLALTGTFNVFGALASMYTIVEASRAGVSIFMAGELLVLNMVNLSGLGLCLKSAARIAHLHRRIVNMACRVHAEETFQTLTLDGTSSTVSRDACARRTALITFLSHTTVGISVYGFVLDRVFVHTSIGGLLTTTWFILGRSLV